jgi:hypothetical protein
VAFLDQLHEGVKLEVHAAFERDLAAIVKVDFNRPGQPDLGDLFVHDPPDPVFVDAALDLQMLLNRPGQALEDFGVLPVALALHHGGAALFSVHETPRFPVSCFPESAIPDPVSVIPILL